VTPYDSLVAIATSRFPYLPVGWLLRDRYESDRHAARVGAPTLLIAADRDEVIPRASTERLLARFKPGVATLRVVAGDHNSVSEQPEYGPILGGARVERR
jgi:pimeloyl-ACP methyl ester carboxylesterase